MHSTKKIPSVLLFSVLVVSLGGLLFGFNTSVISGALLFITKQFSFSTFDQELIVSTLLVGALIGALIGGSMADKFGRKLTLFFTVLLFAIGAFFLVVADMLSSFLIGRFVLGLSIGIVSVCVPLYIAEISPPRIRGALVSCNQLAITIGILVAYLVDYGFSSDSQWRWMFAFAFIPTALLFLGLFFIKETPGWLLEQDKEKEAKKVAKELHMDLGVILERKASEPVKKKGIFHPSVRIPFIIGIGIAVFQQITGINVVIYYAPRIFQAAGLESSQTAILATVGVGVVNVIMTIIALWIIDRVGRRPLLTVGLIGMFFSLLILGFSFYEEAKDLGMAAVISMVAYVAFFAISLGPVAWLIISEVYPMSIRGKAMGIAVFANWLSNYVVSLTFLTLLEELTTAGTFLLYATICLVALWFVKKWVPETKNKTFEEIQHFWTKRS